jgi:hypothetical protein
MTTTRNNNDLVLEGSIESDRFRNELQRYHDQPTGGINRLTLISIPTNDSLTIECITKILHSQKHWKALTISSTCPIQIEQFIKSVLLHSHSSSIDEIEMRNVYQIHDALATAFGKLLHSGIITTKITLSIVTVSSTSLQLISKELSDHQSVIQSIRLSCCTFEDSHDNDCVMDELSALLQHFMALEALKIDSCRFNDTHMAKLLLSLLATPSLKHISLPYNKCQTKTINAIATLLSQPNPTLESFDCSRQYAPDDDDENENDGDDYYLDLDRLLHVLEFDRKLNLKSMNLSTFKIRTDHWIRLIDCLMTTGTKATKELAVTGSSSSLSSLESLFLWKVPMTIDVMKHLTKSLPSFNPNLRTLWVTGNITPNAEGEDDDTPGGSSLYHSMLVSLGQDFVNALTKNWTLHDILLPHVMMMSPSIQRRIKYYTDLNRSRAQYMIADPATMNENNGVGTTTHHVPPSLLPYVLAKAGSDIMRECGHHQQKQCVGHGNISSSSRSSSRITTNHQYRRLYEERHSSLCYYMIRNKILLEHNAIIK